MKVLTETSRVRKELAQIAKQNGGVLKAETVVEFAKDESTALHSQFNWDDTAAAHLYRIHQAKNLIRVQVIFEPRTEEKMQVYVSLPLDRKEDGGGYRRMVDVLSSEDRRKQLLEMALAEFTVFQQKYSRITELAEVFAAFRTAKAKLKKKPHE